MLEFSSDVSVPRPIPKEVLIQVAAAGINNTNINTRIGWYSKAVNKPTNTSGTDGFVSDNKDDAS